MYNSFISQCQKYTLRISPALSSRDQWHVTVTANDKMTGIPVMRPYNPGCRDAIHDDNNNNNSQIYMAPYDHNFRDVGYSWSYRCSYLYNPQLFFSIMVVRLDDHTPAHRALSQVAAARTGPRFGPGWRRRPGYPRHSWIQQISDGTPFSIRAKWSKARRRGHSGLTQWTSAVYVL